MADPLRIALEALRSGAADRAQAIAAAQWERARDHRAASLLALIALERGDARAAYDWTRAALAIHPDVAALHLQAGRVAARLGWPSEARRHLQSALRCNPQFADAAIELARLAIREGDWPTALPALGEAMRIEGARDVAMQMLLDGIPLNEAVPGVDTSEGAPLARGASLVSVIMCSIDPYRRQRARASYAAAFGRWPWELVVIDDARSLAEGYERGMRRSQGELLVFSHDDVELAQIALGERIAAHLDAADIAGVAGAERVAGPAWSHAGQPWLHGSIAYPAAQGYEVHVYNLARASPAKLEVLDGVFLAMRRGTAYAVGWDALNFTGWHGYDVDFCLRAARAGLRLHAAYDLGLVHHSKGRYDAGWRAAAQVLAAKHADLCAVRGTPHSYRRDVASAEEYVALMTRWRALSPRCAPHDETAR